MAISGVAVAAAYAPFLLDALASSNFFRVLAALVAVGFAVYNSR
jgi:hypothetical protein